MARAGTPGRFRGAAKKSTNTPWKSKLMTKQKDLLKYKLESALSAATRSGFGDLLIERLILDVNTTRCLYCTAAAGCTIKSHRQSLCDRQDVLLAYSLHSESSADKAT